MFELEEAWNSLPLFFSRDMSCNQSCFLYTWDASFVVALGVTAGLHREDEQRADER